MSESALLLVDHGSRRADANACVAGVAALVRARLGDGAIVEVAHLELAAPSIPEGVAACVARGAREVIVVPYFLGPGRHAIADVPRLAHEAARAHPGLALRVAEPLGVHPLLAELVLLRAQCTK